MYCFKVIILAFSFIHFNTAQFVPTTTEVFPFFAYLESCLGSIIHERYILSSADCFYYLDACDVVFHVGRDHRSNATGSVAYPAESIFLKQNSTHETGYQDDIALIKLAQPIEFNSRVQPVKLDHTIVLNINESFSALGFGITSNGGPSDDLHVATLNAMGSNSGYYNSYYSQVEMGINDRGGPSFITQRCEGFVQFGVLSAVSGITTANNTALYSSTFALINSENCAWLKEKSDNEIQC